jgi:hypothetical protein
VAHLHEAGGHFVAASASVVCTGHRNPIERRSGVGHAASRWSGCIKHRHENSLRTRSLHAAPPLLTTWCQQPSYRAHAVEPPGRGRRTTQAVVGSSRTLTQQGEAMPKAPSPGLWVTCGVTWSSPRSWRFPSVAVFGGRPFQQPSWRSTWPCRLHSGWTSRRS